jgi:hypothetical protein
VLYEGEGSSESCLLLLPIAKNSVEVLKEKVLALFEEFFRFFRLCLRISCKNLYVADSTQPDDSSEIRAGQDWPDTPLFFHLIFQMPASNFKLSSVLGVPDLLPTLQSKLDGGGIFLLRQNSEGLALFSSRYYA